MSKTEPFADQSDLERVLDSFESPTGYPTVCFDMRSHGDQANVLISDNVGHAIALHQMSKEGDQHWHLALGLRPGSYRYRYYVSRGKLTHYAKPSEVDEFGLPMDGLDAMLEVSSRTATLSEEGAQDAKYTR